MKYDGFKDSQQIVNTKTCYTSWIVNKYEQTQVSKIGKRKMNELPKK